MISEPPVIVSYVLLPGYDSVPLPYMAGILAGLSVGPTGKGEKSCCGVWRNEGHW